MSCAQHSAPCRSRQSGVGLIEVLISLLVLSIGLLGMAALQIRTLRNNESSFERGIAVVETHAIADAMRADRTNAINGGFNLNIDSEDPDGSSFAETALAAWRGNLIAMLGPDATGSIHCDGTLCTITVRWNDERASGGDPELTVRTQVQL